SVWTPPYARPWSRRGWRWPARGASRCWCTREAGDGQKKPGGPSPPGFFGAQEDEQRPSDLGVSFKPLRFALSKRASASLVPPVARNVRRICRRTIIISRDLGGHSAPSRSRVCDSSNASVACVVRFALAIIHPSSKIEGRRRECACPSR